MPLAGLLLRRLLCGCGRLGGCCGLLRLRHGLLLRLLRGLSAASAAGVPLAGLLLRRLLSGCGCLGGCRGLLHLRHGLLPDFLRRLSAASAAGMLFARFLLRCGLIFRCQSGEMPLLGGDALCRSAELLCKLLIGAGRVLHFTDDACGFLRTPVLCHIFLQVSFFQNISVSALRRCAVCAVCRLSRCQIKSGIRESTTSA